MDQIAMILQSSYESTVVYYLTRTLALGKARIAIFQHITNFRKFSFKNKY